MAYSWRGGLPGGGFCNTGAFDTRTSGGLACGGDVWGPRTSANGGDLWLGAMWGCSPNNIPYGRSVVFSKRNPGVCYFGEGGLKAGIGGGGFATLVGHKHTMKNNSIGFGTSMTVAPDGGNPAGFHPRPTGRQILVELDTAADKEYIYACLPGYGLGRCSDNSQGVNWSKMGSVPTPPAGCWKAGVILPSGNLLFYTYLTTQTSGTITYKVTSPRTTASVTTVGGAPAVVHDAAVSPANSRVFAACGPNGVREVTSDGATWNAVTGNSFFSGFHPASIAIGSDGNIWVGTGQDGSGHGMALSPDNGASWSWVMGSTHLNFSVMGANVPWWLQGRPDPTSSGYAVEQVEVNPFDPTNIAAFGRGGAWMTHDSGATWRPSMYGMDGTEVASLGVGAGGAVGGTVADWSVFSSSDYLLHSANTAGPSGGGNTDSAGNTYTLVSGTPYDVRKNGVSIADDEFRGWCVKPSAIKVAANGTVYVGQFGGVHVGDPVSTPPPPVTQPTHGSPTIDQANPQVTQVIHALANDGTWDGTKPLAYSGQWQNSTASGGPWTNLSAGVSTTAFTGDTYTVQAGDNLRFLRCRVTGQNSAGPFVGTTPATNQVTTALTAPVSSVSPVATPNAPAAGQPLNATTGTWLNSPASYAGQWQNATSSSGPWTNVSAGASTTNFPNDTYTPVSADAGTWFRCRVTASNAVGPSTPSASNAVGPVSTSVVTVTDAIQTPDLQTIQQGDQFIVVWVATTNSPTGIAASQVQVDGGPWQNADLIGDNGTGTTTWQYTFQSLAVGTHVIVTRDVVNT